MYAVGEWRCTFYLIFFSLYSLFQNESWCDNNHLNFKSFIFQQHIANFTEIHFMYVSPTPKECNNSLYVSVILYVIKNTGKFHFLDFKIIS